MASDNIDGSLLTEMILDRYEGAIKGMARAEHERDEHRSKVWSLEQDVKRLTDERNTLRADCARAERELEALKAQLAGNGDDENPF